MNPSNYSKNKEKIIPPFKIHSFNKHAMLDDAFDLLFLVVAAMLIFFFFSSYIIGGVKSSTDISIAEMTDFKRVDNALNNLRVQLDQGYNLEHENIDQKIAQSKLLQGRTITDCIDYWTKADCNADAVGVREGNAGITCTWDDDDKECLQLITQGSSPII